MLSRRSRLAAAAALSTWIGMSSAGLTAGKNEAPSLSLPIACTLGRDCWAFQYFDHDAGPGARDYACGARSYDGHTGTDFALRDAGEIEKGVRVLAAAPGTVRAVRDGMPDEVFDPENAARVKDKDCGNGVAVSHGGGWETQYCHLRRGSVRVKPGQRVDEGTTLGTVGLSGRTQFAHVELVVRHEGKAVDPFTGGGDSKNCGRQQESLWSKHAIAALDYSPVDILGVGVTGTMPSAEKARAGRLNASTLPADAPLLAAWVTLVGVREGDRLRLSLVAPGGAVVASQEDRLKKTQIFYFMFVGDRARSPWPAGNYVARAELTRPTAGRDLSRTAEAVVRVR